MEQIALGDTGRLTTRLGFGCSSLMGASSRRASLAILESAYDAGIRHFDVAPMYGYGEAESCLGEFLQRHRDQVTITTKYGIPPAKKSSLITVGRRIAGPIVKSFPGLKQRLASTANTVTHNLERATFTPSEALASLKRSLIALRTGHIDLWLLHEASAADLQDDALLNMLEDEVKKGTIGAFGIGSEATKIPALIAEHPGYCRTLQYEWSVLDSSIDSSIGPTNEATPLSSQKRFRIHHRSLTTNFRAVYSALTQDKQLCQHWSASTCTDLGNPEDLARLMLKASLVMNPNSIVLFSSKNPRHIQTNVQVARDKSLDHPARQLYELVQLERDQLLTNGAGTN
jgi:aryl-alcohol dehydrogenase-like predicted oxidoreductase